MYKVSVLAVVNQLQEKEGSEALGKLMATDTDGFSLEALDGSEAEEEEVAQRREGDQVCTETQVICQSFYSFKSLGTLKSSYLWSHSNCSWSLQFCRMAGPPVKK